MLAVLIGLILVGQVLLWVGGAFLVLLGARFAFRFITAPKRGPMLTPQAPLAPPPPSTVSPPVAAAAATAPTQPEPSLVQPPPRIDDDSDWSLINPFKPIHEPEDALISAYVGIISAFLQGIVSILEIVGALMLGDNGAVAAAVVGIQILVLAACAWGLTRKPPSRIAAGLLLFLGLLQLAGDVFLLLTEGVSLTNALLFTLDLLAVSAALMGLRGAVWSHKVGLPRVTAAVDAVAAPTTADSAGARRTAPIASTEDPDFFSLPIRQRARIAWAEQRGMRQAMRRRTRIYLAVLVAGFAILSVGFWLKVAMDGPPTTAAAPASPAPTPPREVAPVASAPVASADQPADVVPAPDGSVPPAGLVRSWGENDEACRGAEDPQAPEVKAACSVRDNAFKLLTNLGWCHGLAGDTDAERKWRRCGPADGTAVAEQSFHETPIERHPIVATWRGKPAYVGDTIKMRDFYASKWRLTCMQAVIGGNFYGISCKNPTKPKGDHDVYVGTLTPDGTLLLQTAMTMEDGSQHTMTGDRMAVYAAYTGCGLDKPVPLPVTH